MTSPRSIYLAVLLAILGGAPSLSAATVDPALDPPPVLAPPGPQYAASTRTFQGIPGIERARGGRLWAIWYGGGPGEGPENYVMIATSGDDGRTWSDVKLVIDPPGEVRAFDPCLWLDPAGRLWLFWAQAWHHWDGRAGVWCITTDRPDEENPQWSPPRRPADGIAMNKPIVARSGQWLLPVAIWGDKAKPDQRQSTSLGSHYHFRPEQIGSNVYSSADQGATWQFLGQAYLPEHACDEHMLVERRDSSLWMLVRTRYGIGESTSTDGGRTWSPGRPSSIAHPTARFFIRRLASGNLLLVKHGPLDERIGRSHLTAYLSRDDGRTWSGGLLLDERNGVSYPDGCQAPDGAVYVIYDYSRTGDKQILMATFTEKDVATGKPVSAKARLRVLVNQATGISTKKSMPQAGKYTLAKNEDGEPLLDGPAAIVESLDGEKAPLAVGQPIFTNRKYVFYDLPAGLHARQFLRTTLEKSRFVCRRPGVVFVATPTKGRNRDSLADELLRLNFTKARIPEFVLFPGEANVCSVYQKKLQTGEKIDLGKWGVVIF